VPSEDNMELTAYRVVVPQVAESIAYFIRMNIDREGTNGCGTKKQNDRNREWENRRAGVDSKVPQQLKRRRDPSS